MIWIAMTTLKSRLIRTFDELDSIKDYWLDLEIKDTQSTIFQSWDWNRSWCEHVLTSNNKAYLHTHLIEDDSGNIVAILPFFKTSLAGHFLKITQFLGHRMSVRNNILIADPNNQNLVNEIVNCMIATLGYNDLLHLRHLASDSSFTKMLINKKLAIPQCKNLWVANNPDITDQTTRLGRSSRKTVRKLRNRLEKNYNCKIVVHTADTFSRAFDTWYSLHDMRFKSLKRQSLLTGHNIDFLKAITLLPGKSKNFEILTLQADEKIIAARFLINDGVRCYAYQTGFDPEFSRYSPLKILMLELLRYAFEELHCEIVDFGPGYEKNKYEWSPTIDINYSSCIGGKGIYIKSLAALYRYAFHKNLPPVDITPIISMKK